MKITKRQLRRIIKEERAKLMAEVHPRDAADFAVDTLDYIKGLVMSTAAQTDPQQALDLIADAVEGYRRG